VTESVETVLLIYTSRSLDRSGEGRGDESGANLYENFAEATVGKGVVDMTHVLPTGTTDYEEVAAAEERGEKEKAKGLTRRSESEEV
jgi:hypothetical protein